ncbi:MAG: hypothetical protein A2201_13470 [Alicyclobacillus sp. RIFOXYA1_FULL_53_8]|nr:MAG: hypothetical protein A2201_13470 [Alicyclobacillus sp. RIFOXYA1_FULL_53_8]
MTRWSRSEGSTRTWLKTSLALGTVVRTQVVGTQSEETVEQAQTQAMAAMRAVEDACSRFDKDSELSRLVLAPVGSLVEVSPILFQALHFACEVAEWTEGRFDPTVAARMDELGFTQHYLTGESVHWAMQAAAEATFRDLELDEANRAVRLHRPLRLDLGAVAKGLAVDLAVKELSAFGFDGFVVDAGGDVYVAGCTENGEPWTVGIRHPVLHEQSILTLKVQDVAVCTSGTYERPSPREEGAHHILNAQTKRSAHGFLSATAIGPFAMMADAFSTAAFLYPPAQALDVLERVGLEGITVSEDLHVELTSGMERYLHE